MMKTKRLLPTGIAVVTLAGLTVASAIALAQYPPGELPRRTVPSAWQGAPGSTPAPQSNGLRTNTNVNGAGTNAAGALDPQGYYSDVPSPTPLPTPQPVTPATLSPPQPLQNGVATPTGASVTTASGATQATPPNSDIRFASNPGPAAVTSQRPTYTTAELPNDLPSTSSFDGRQLTVSRCLVQAMDDIEVPATESGRLVTVNIKPGTSVTPDDLLAQLDDSQAQLNLKAAQQELTAALKKSTDDVDTRFAVAALNVAKAELQQAESVSRRDPSSQSTNEIRRLQLAEIKAELAVDKSKLEQEVAGLTAEVKQAAVDAATENIKRCQIKALSGGDVVTLFRKQGEWINEGEPLARLIRLDELHVLGQVSAKDWDPADLDGRSVTVLVEMARGRTVPLEGKVTYVAPTLQAGSLYRIQATVTNQMDRGHWVMRPGGEVKMVINLGQ